MSGQGDLDLKEEVVLAGQTAKPQDSSCVEERSETSNNEDEKEELMKSAHLESSTFLWSEGKGKNVLLGQDDVTESEERDTGISRGSQDLSENSQTEGDMRSKSKWRESMSEGERLLDDEIQMQRKDKGDGSLADDEDEDDDYKEKKKRERVAAKPCSDFTPHVQIVDPNTKDPVQIVDPNTKDPVQIGDPNTKGPNEESCYFRNMTRMEQKMERYETAQPFYQYWEEHENLYHHDDVFSNKLRLFFAVVAAAVLFPLLVWGGYALLPFDPPLLQSPTLRVIYTLRCSFFAIIPIVLGMLVQGVARLRFSALMPLYNDQNKEVLVHWHYVNESLSLFLIYFLQLAVLATYISQDQLKLVPLLTIVFAFGRLIYWICLALNSTIRAFGFGLSFLPMLTMLGANLYYVCSSLGQGAIFEVAPPVTAAPAPRMRWWF